MTGMSMSHHRDALARGRIAVARCGDCGRQQAFPAETCFTCGSGRLAPDECDGRGRVYSWVVNHHAFDDALAAETPYMVAMVTLDGGGRLYARLENGRGGVPAVAADMPVVLDAEKTAGRLYPVYRPA